jgi:hypothetical protein
MGLAGGAVANSAFLIRNRLVNNLGFAENSMAVGGNAIRQNTGCGPQERARNQEDNYRELFVWQIEIPLNSRNCNKAEGRPELIMQILHRQGSGKAVKSLADAMALGVGAMRGQVGGHGIELRAQPDLDRINLFVQHVYFEIDLIDLGFEIFPHPIDLAIQRGEPFKNQIELAVDRFENDLHLALVHGLPPVAIE